jgi:hypothetical protein
VKSVDSSYENNLPVKRGLRSIYTLSLIIALLMAVSSLAGILFQSEIYPSDELLSTFMSNDVVNLSIGLPIILGSIFLTMRKKLIGLILWPGALFFVLYNYLIYVLAMPFNLAFLLDLVLVTLSLYTIIALVASIDGESIKKKLSGKVHEKISGIILTGMGILFLFQVAGVMIIALANQTSITGTELALHISDFLYSPAMIIGGILLWRRKDFGYVSGLGLLFQLIMLFIGLVMFLIIQAVLMITPFALVDVVVISIMSLIGFVPLVLFVRGVLLN